MEQVKTFLTKRKFMILIVTTVLLLIASVALLVTNDGFKLSEFNESVVVEVIEDEAGDKNQQALSILENISSVSQIDRMNDKITIEFRSLEEVNSEVMSRVETEEDIAEDDISIYSQSAHADMTPILLEILSVLIISVITVTTLSFYAHKFTYQTQQFTQALKSGGILLVSSLVAFTISLGILSALSLIYRVKVEDVYLTTIPLITIAFIYIASIANDIDIPLKKMLDYIRKHQAKIATILISILVPLAFGMGNESVIPLSLVFIFTMLGILTTQVSILGYARVEEAFKTRNQGSASKTGQQADTAKKKDTQKKREYVPRQKK